MNTNNEIQAVDITRTREDYFVFCKRAMKGFQNQRIYYFVALVVLVLVLILAIDVFGRKRYMTDVNAWLFFLGMYCASLYFTMSALQRRFKQELFNDNQAFLRKKRVTIDEKCFRETSDVSDGFTMWQGVDRIEKTDTLILVFVDKTIGYVIPIRNFSTPEQANQFYENMLAYWHKAHGRAVPVNTQ